MTSDLKYFDIHSHLNFPDYDADRDEVIEKMKQDGVGTITVGTNLKTSREAVLLASKHANLWASIGVHPADGLFDFDEGEFGELVKHPKVVAIGECGLDFFRFKGDLEAEKKRQQDLFLKQIDFAAKNNRPIMIHARNTYGEICEIIESYNKNSKHPVRGNAHFFAGSIDEARRFLDLGFTISVTGVITFVRNYDEVVRFVPTDRLMSETDAPFVSPEPFRGKRNEPGYVAEVVKKITEIKGEPIDRIKEIMLQNAVRGFKL